MPNVWCLVSPLRTRRLPFRYLWYCSSTGPVFSTEGKKPRPRVKEDIRETENGKFALVKSSTSILFHPAAVSSTGTGINIVTTAPWCIHSLSAKLGPNSIQQMVCNIFQFWQEPVGTSRRCGRNFFCIPDL